MIRRFALGIVLLAAAASLRAADPAEPTVPTPALYREREIRYTSSAGLSVRALVLEPRDASHTYPGLVVNHGGFDGIGRGFRPVLEQWVGEGYVVIAPYYRGEGGSDGQVEFAKGEVDDSLGSLAYLKSLPGVDPDRIGMIGYSHGAAVTLLASARTKDLRAVVSVSGVTDVRRLLAESKRANEVVDRGKIRWNPDDPGEWRVRSVIHDAAKITAPVLLIHGEQDNLIPPSQSVILAKALEGLGRPVTLRLFPDKAHSLNGDPDVFEEARRFLADRLHPARLAPHAPWAPGARPAPPFPQSRPATELGPPPPTLRDASEAPPPEPDADSTGWSTPARFLPGPETVAARERLPKNAYAGVGHGGIYQRMSAVDLEKRLDWNIRHPLLAGIDFNVNWAELEPEEGVFDWSALDRPLETWRKAGKRVSINVVTIIPRGATPYAGHAVPGWVFRKGARGIPVESSTGKKGRETPASVWPVLWDPVYLAEYEKFVRALAARYDGAPGIDVITAGVGKLGGLTVLDPKIAPEERRYLSWEYRRLGFTPERYFKAIERILDIYRTAFRKTALRLQISHFFDKTDDRLLPWMPRCAEAAATRGIGLFYQGITGGEKYVRKMEKKPVSDLFAKWSGKVACGAELVNPIHGTRAENRAFMGSLAGAVRNALGEGAAGPPTGISYLNLYLADVTAANPEDPRFDPEWLAAMELAWKGLKRLPSGDGTPAKVHAIPGTRYH